MASQEYLEYLKSEEWAARRKWALERAEHRCQVCNSPDSLDVHHRTYERVGHEWPSDLTVLCRVCHELYHDRTGQPPRPIPKRRPRRRYADPEADRLSQRMHELQKDIEDAEDCDVKLEIMVEKSKVAQKLRDLTMRAGVEG